MIYIAWKITRTCSVVLSRVGNKPGVNVKSKPVTRYIYFEMKSTGNSIICVTLNTEFSSSILTSDDTGQKGLLGFNVMGFHLESMPLGSSIEGKQNWLFKNH